MFSKLFRQVGKFLNQIGDAIDPEIITLTREVKEPVLRLAYYCIPAQKNCDWVGKRCHRCINSQRGREHAVIAY
jgi:hypothetical protein